MIPTNRLLAQEVLARSLCLLEARIGSVEELDEVYI
jgi:hypothetical protein